ncbi:aspartic and glutamic acid-rich protein [Drosophila tropicalis]|uniref:aspartic and glutamic acid-rich protein n=1 Tax=Drosophila tropicalis TaxID=46794 RepID=UPI0035ABF32C
MANSIELSLWEMQLSQNYENVQRKFSYDEDALDYELIKEEEEEEEEEDEEHEAKHDLVDDESESDTDTDIENKVNEVEQSKLLVKDVTPESDYASEANYATNEPSDESNDDVDDEEDEDEDEDDAKAVYFLKLPAASSQADEENETDTDTDNSSTDSDFLSTTYTWNLRNAPKLRINDDNNDDENDNDDDGDEAKEEEEDNELKRQQQYKHQESYEKPAIRPATPTPTPTPQGNPMAELQTQKLLFKLDKLERSWPWADREKIIYKQSTCHLVPRKPLGLVGQRMQLLLKDKTQQ